ETAKPVKLGDYFGHKPLILNLVYYNCTMLCGEALAGLASAMRLVKFDVGNEFDVVTVSFDPRETPEMAAAKKKDYVSRYGRANAVPTWLLHCYPGRSSSGIEGATVDTNRRPGATTTSVCISGSLVLASWRDRAGSSRHAWRPRPTARSGKSLRIVGAASDSGG